MLNLTLATASLNQTPLDWEGNITRILEALRTLSIRTSSYSGAPDIVLLPELCISGYGCEDAFHSTDVIHRSIDALLNIAAEARVILPDSAVVCGLPLRIHDHIYNCAAVLYDGKIQGITPKSNLAGDGVHYEPRWFTAFNPLDDEFRSIVLNGVEIPFGMLLFEVKNLRFCIEICEDSWVANRPALHYITGGLDIILNPAASHFAFAKQETRKNIARESSRAFSCLYASVNSLGNEAGRLIYDGGGIFASNGDIMLESPRLSYRDSILSEVYLDLEPNRVMRGRTYSYKEQKGPVGRAFPDLNVVRINPTQPDLFRLPLPREQVYFIKANVPGDVKSHNHNINTRELEFLRTVTLGLFDYFRKSGVKGIVISLSGGADSATCAVMVQRMVLYSIQELGAEQTLRRLGLEEIEQENLVKDYDNRVQKRKKTPVLSMNQDTVETQTPAPEKIVSLEEVTAFITSKILHTVYQETDQSSSVTREAAAEVARALNANHHEVSIQSIIDGYRTSVERLLGTGLTWEKDDLTLQNIQARARSPMAWMLANATGSLLLTTSNRSEAAVGYCTMDGDTSGGLAPIAGIDKASIRNWLEFMEKTGDPLGGPIPALKAVNAQQPTAELRPQGDNQTDESDLMPYDLLDKIEKLAIRDREAPGEVLEALLNTDEIIEEYEPDVLRNHIKRFFKLWARNQWKRERYAPSFHLDDENLDPRTWYRFPILSGGYQEELEEL